jgi:uncharacterized protein
MDKMEFELNEEEKNYCVSLARKSIEYFFENNRIMQINNFPKKFEETKASFVTLFIENNLRGCIGHIKAIQPLYKNIIENAVSSAFNDPRFYPLSKEEFENVKIEVSVLTIPKKIEYDDYKDLFEKINVGNGLILKKGISQATYLPSVWEQIPEKEEFLSSLCMKAGLNRNAWKNEKIDVEVYNAIKCKE